MGNSASKAAKTAATGAARRQFPTRIPPPPISDSPASASVPPEAPVAGPTVHPTPRASETKDESISLDARDPDFAASLRSLGPVQPSSTRSNTSTFTSSPSRSTPATRPQTNDPSPPQGQNIFPNPAQNPALRILEARDRLAAEAEEEFTRARMGGKGRRFLDLGTIREVIALRDEKMLPATEIESKMGLAEGVVDSLAAVRGVRVAKVTKDDAGIYD